MRRIFLGSVIFSVGLLSAVPLHPEGNPAGEAGARLDLAQVYLEMGQPKRAAELAEESLLKAPGDPDVRVRAQELLRASLEAAHREARAQKELERQKQELKLLEAERLIAEGKLDSAAQKIVELLDKIEDEGLLGKASAELEQAHTDWLQAKSVELWRGWLGNVWIVVLLSLALLSLPLLLRPVRWVVGWIYHRRKKWSFGGVEDSTGLGLDDYAFHAFDHWSDHARPPSAGLLRLGTVAVQSTPDLRHDEGPKIDLAASFNALPEVGGVKLGAVAGVFTSLWRWILGRRPSIAVSCASPAGSATIVIRLTCRHWGGRITTFQQESPKDLMQATNAVESATYKMYYLLANDSSVTEAAAADQLRQGLKHLHLFLAQGNSGSLNEAWEAFRTVRREYPSLEEAYLYEGVALDLLERHDEAEKRFHHLATRGEGELQEKARYNEAIAQFRKYRPEALDEATKALDEVIGKGTHEAPSTDELLKEPIKAFALAAKANAIAHKPIFWQQIVIGDRAKEDAEVLERKAQGRPHVEQWIQEVLAISGALGAVVTRAANGAEGWDDALRRQLEWAIANARGNVYLNSANRFFSEPYRDEDEQKLRTDYLHEAHQAFKDCEMLLYPGVETLTNLATVLNAIGQPEAVRQEARQHCEAAIKINRNYEYAYYRLAQSWEQEGKRENVRETMASLPRAPKIPSFIDMFAQYNVQPKVE